MLRVGILLDVEIFLNCSLGIRKEGPLGADRRAEFLERMMIVGGDGCYLSVRHGDLRVERRQFPMLLVLLGAVVSARERENQWISALQLAELARLARMVGQFVVGETPPGTISERMA